jgi:hypothetical protein
MRTRGAHRASGLAFAFRCHPDRATSAFPVATTDLSSITALLRCDKQSRVPHPSFLRRVGGLMAARPSNPCNATTRICSCLPWSAAALPPPRDARHATQRSAGPGLGPTPPERASSRVRFSICISLSSPTQRGTSRAFDSRVFPTEGQPLARRVVLTQEGGTSLRFPLLADPKNRREGCPPRSKTKKGADHIRGPRL